MSGPIVDMGRRLFPNIMLKQSSRYEQKMLRLSCKIFNEYYFPELTPTQLDYTPYEKRNKLFFDNATANMRVVERHMKEPLDISPTSNHKYYPAHPQLRKLTHQLREYGLYRDEHRDFNEAMKAVAISRGKVFRERRGSLSKDSKKKK